MKTGRLAAVLLLAVLATGCGIPRTTMKVIRTLSPVRLVPSPRGKAPVDEYDEAKKLFLRGQFDQAIVTLDSWLIRYPGNALEPAAMYYLANAQFQARRPERAKVSYERLLKAYPDSEWARYGREDLVTMAQTGGHVPMARPKLRWWHPLDWFTPDPPAVREFKLGRDLFDRREYEQAIIVFRQLAERHPENPLAPASWHYVGRCYERVAEIVQARDTFAMMVQKYKGTHWEKLAGEDYERLREE